MISISINDYNVDNADDVDNHKKNDNFDNCFTFGAVTIMKLITEMKQTVPTLKIQPVGFIGKR